MATTTTNFGWDVPTSTDLVKNGATAISTLGQDIDTTMVDLKGGTSGQILSKASNTDMDFVWIANDQGDITGVTAGTGISGGGTSGTVTVTNSMATTMTTKGDLVPATGSGTFARLGVGANDTLLVADSTQSTGLAWRTNATQFPWASYSPSTGGLTLGNGTLSARYSYIGKTVILNITLTLGSTSAITGDLRFSLPTGASKFSAGSIWLEDVSVGVYTGTALVNFTDVYARATATNATYGTTSNLSSTVPFTWATGDMVIIQTTYEAS